MQSVSRGTEQRGARVGQPRGKSGPGHRGDPRGGWRDGEGKKVGKGLPCTLLCTTRVQAKGAGGRMRPEHRAGGEGGARNNGASKCPANCLQRACAGKGNRAEGADEGKR